MTCTCQSHIINLPIPYPITQPFLNRNRNRNLAIPIPIYGRGGPHPFISICNVVGRRCPQLAGQNEYSIFGGRAGLCRR